MKSTFLSKAQSSDNRKPDVPSPQPTPQGRGRCNTAPAHTLQRVGVSRRWERFSPPMNPLSRPSGTLSPGGGKGEGVGGPLGGSRAQGAIKVRGNLSLRERAGVRGNSALILALACLTPIAFTGCNS